jgi:hypothetical protein
MGTPMELAATAVACMGGPWGPWDPMGVMALAWVATDPATGAAAWLGGLMGATTATEQALEGATWELRMGKAPCQVLLVSLFKALSPIVRRAISECNAVWACCVLQIL